MNIPSNIKRIIVDGSNIAFASRVGKKADIRNLEIILTELREIQLNQPELTFEVVCDASLKYNISDPQKYEKWVQKGTIRQAPPQTKADEILIELMIKYDGEILLITNDRLREYGELKGLKTRIQYGFIFVFGEILVKRIENHTLAEDITEEVKDIAEVNS